MNKRIFLSLTFCLTLIACGSLIFAAAQNTQQPPEQRGQGHGGFAPGEMVMGTLSSIGVDRVEVKKQDGSSQVVMVNDQTKYQQGQQGIQMEDLKPGDRVFVRGKMNDNKEFVAANLRRVTDEEMQRFQSGGERAGGQIVSIDGNQLKVQNPRQGERVVIVNEQTTFMKDGQPITLKDLKVGDRIFAQGKETDGKFVATRVMSGQFQRGGMGRRGPGADQEKQ
ncbi:MAG TPA: DUF5666 domain-containing protein [Terriglobia bacterium]|nr:DUF5666 domain-containing protein [Terriglobia bacterium]